MSTLIRAGEAAAILGVTKPSLYAYVSRGRLTRTKAADGRTSLFARDEVEQLAARARHAPTGPRPTIDVHVSSTITTIDETAVRYRGFDLATLAADHGFEDVAELLWSATGADIGSSTVWPGCAADDVAAVANLSGLGLTPAATIAVAAQVLATRHPEDRSVDAARRLLLATPVVLGSARRTGRYAARLAGVWRRRPTSELVDAVDTALLLLADHELATSTLAVRLAASVRAGPYPSFAAGLATVEGTLHGAASAAAHRLLADCERNGPEPVIAGLLGERRSVAGFGHSIYRGVDPRFPVLLDRVRRLDPERAAVVDAVVAAAGRAMAPQPNVDLALGALTWLGGLDPDVPIFAVARIVGWGAHHEEETDERPVRFRGVSTPVR
ncbi:MAG TPA: citrate synthase [Ilumatobacteraceae bacterium]|nr:citrate synthase [Ilumatobacteraceae bacterium]